MNGKNKCKILKDIRREIAKQNDIDLVIEECKYKGDCSGTCPKCEAEVCYLEKELEKRRALGKSVAVAGLVATITASSTGCALVNRILPKAEVDGLLPFEETQLTGDLAISETAIEGEIAPEKATEEILQGKFYPETDEPEASKEPSKVAIMGMLVAPDFPEETELPETTAETASESKIPQ